MTAPQLSDYERKRAENVERNNARLRAMGLISKLEEEQSNATAWGKTSPDASSVVSVVKKRKNNNTIPQEPSRKSRRLQGEIPEVAADNDLEDLLFAAAAAPPQQFASNDEERLARVEECRQARQRAALEVAKAGAVVAAKENPTATYDHCLMRVKTMTEKKLANRVKAIERATGKHCVVKMAIFKSCLQDEGMWDLAKLASEALERLKALLPPPQKAE